jgi:hypothetical protein
MKSLCFCSPLPAFSVCCLRAPVSHTLLFFSFQHPIKRTRLPSVDTVLHRSLHNTRLIGTSPERWRHLEIPRPPGHDCHAAWSTSTIQPRAGGGGGENKGDQAHLCWSTKVSLPASQSGKEKTPTSLLSDILLSRHIYILHMGGPHARLLFLRLYTADTRPLPPSAMSPCRPIPIIAVDTPTTLSTEHWVYNERVRL